MAEPTISMDKAGALIEKQAAEKEAKRHRKWLAKYQTPTAKLGFTFGKAVTKVKDLLKPISTKPSGEGLGRTAALLKKVDD